MNKRGIIKFIFVVIAAYLSIHLMISSGIGFESVLDQMFLGDIMFAVTIFMYSNRKTIKKYNFIYNVISLLLLVFSSLYVEFIIFNYSICITSPGCDVEIIAFFNITYPLFLFLILLFSIKDIFNKTNKTNDLLAILVSTIIILIHLRYRFEPNLLNDPVFKYDYLSQNYIYFTIMYLLVLIHYKLNKQES